MFTYFVRMSSRISEKRKEENHIFIFSINEYKTWNWRKLTVWATTYERCANFFNEPDNIFSVFCTIEIVWKYFFYSGRCANSYENCAESTREKIENCMSPNQFKLFNAKPRLSNQFFLLHKTHSICLIAWNSHTQNRVTWTRFSVAKNIQVSRWRFSLRILHTNTKQSHVFASINLNTENICRRSPLKIWKKSFPHSFLLFKKYIFLWKWMKNTRLMTIFLQLFSTLLSFSHLLVSFTTNCV